MQKTAVEQTLQHLIAFNSENPPGNEKAIGLFVAQYLKNLGLTVSLREFASNRTNVIARLKGASGHTLLITPHLDTVPAGRSWTTQPFRAAVRNGYMYGLGATDCKVNLACALEAIKQIVTEKTKLGYTLIFAATADEESGSNVGLIPLLDKGLLSVDAALVLDADDFAIIVAQKGLMHVKVKIKGLKAHGAYPWKGKNAIAMAVNILQDVQKQRFVKIKNRFLHPATVNIGTIKGGDKVNVVADWCEFELDYRFLPGTQEKPILNDLKKIIKRYAHKYSVEVDGVQDPYTIALSHPLVTSLCNAWRKNKIRPCLQGSEGATVITFFQHKNIPAVATGFGLGGKAHMADECVSLKNLRQGVCVLKDFLTHFAFGL